MYRTTKIKVTMLREGKDGLSLAQNQSSAWSLRGKQMGKSTNLINMDNENITEKKGFVTMN